MDNLRAVARATNLMNVARTTYSGGSADVVLSMDVRRRDESDFATVGGPIMDLGEYCNRRFREGEEFVTVSAGTRPQLRPGDCVRFRIENRSSRAQDVTVLFMDSRWGIQSYFPMMSGDQNRIEAGGERYIAENSAGFLVTPTTTGVERMLMIAVPGSGGLLADFSYLAQPQLTATRSLGEGSELHDLLDQAGFRGESTRGLAQGTQESTTTQVLSWVTESD